jgi:hypothetical protein
MLAQLFHRRPLLSNFALLSVMAIATFLSGTAEPAYANRTVVSGQLSVSSGNFSINLGTPRSVHPYYYDRYGRPIHRHQPRTTVRVIQRTPSVFYDTSRTRPSQVIVDSTLVNPVIVDSQIIDSTLINPTIVNSDRYSDRYYYDSQGRRLGTRRISIPMQSDLQNCVELGNLQRACYR